MQIRRFFCPELSDECQIQLPDAESTHALRVLRLSAGARMQLLDGKGTIADAELLPPPAGQRNPKHACCQILERRTLPRPSNLTLLVAPPRGKAFDLVLRAAVELGFAAIQPILCTYGVARPEGTSEGWNQTLIAAVKQSANPWLPVIKPPMEFADALACPEYRQAAFGASPAAEATPAQTVDANAVTALWVGPEGGFAPAEESALLSSGLRPITIGQCVLRVETAVPALAGYLAGAKEASK